MIRVLLTTTSFQDAPIVVDWATSVMDKDAAALLPFGAHKGYSLSLINEITAAFIGGTLPALRSRWAEDREKHTPAFYFQAIHPDAWSSGDFALGRSRTEKIKAVLDYVLGGGNSGCLLPGQLEAQADRPRSTSNP